MKYLCLITLILFAFSLEAKVKFNYKEWLRDRNARSHYKAEEFDKAEELFRENAIENPNVGQFHFNRGTALYKENDFEAAQHEFQMALNDRRFADKDQIYHNMGNIAFKNEEYDKAIDLYRKALIENSQNQDARTNFELARMMLMQNESEADSDNDNSEQDEDQQQQSQSNQGEGNNEQKQQQQQAQAQLDQNKQEAERMLQALEQKQEQERNKEETKGNMPRSGRFW